MRYYIENKDIILIMLNYNNKDSFMFGVCNA